MKFCKILFCCAIATLLTAASNAAEGKKKTSSKQVTKYRQSYAKKSTTVTNPHAITAKQKAQEDPGATKAFKAFVGNYWKLRNKKNFDTICSAADKLISSQKKLTDDQKTQIYFLKADAQFADKDYDSAIVTAKKGISIGGDAAGSCASVIINAAAAEKKINLAEQTIKNFELSQNFADGNYFNAVAALRFSQKRYEDAFECYKSYGRQPNLTNSDKVKILNGFAKYYIQKKNYANAIGQYKAIKSLPKIDAYNDGNADMQIAACYILMKNKDKALEIYHDLAKSAKHSGIKKAAQNEIKKLSAKPKQQKKKSSSRKKK